MIHFFVPNPILKGPFCSPYHTDDNDELQAFSHCHGCQGQDKRGLLLMLVPF